MTRLACQPVWRPAPSPVRGNRTRKTILSGTNALITANYTLGTGNRLAAWSVAETDLVGQIDVAGSSTEPIGTDPRFGELWVGLDAGSGQVTNKFTPWVSGTNFYAFGLLVGLGSQKVVAAIRDAAGNMGYATNSVFLAVVTNGSYACSDAGCVTNVRYAGKDYSSTLSLAWDGQYRLTSASTNGVLAESCTYDAFGRRISITSGGATSYLVYDGPHAVAEVNSTGGLTRSYLYGPGIDNVIAMTVHAAASTSTYWYVKDHLGSVVALTDKDGRVAESYRYDAWGRVSVYGAGGEPLAESAVGNRILWQGREYSWKTGLYYFRARWYDPVTGRWLSNDPIGTSGGLNQYVFCANNPVNFTDPMGLYNVWGGWATWGSWSSGWHWYDALNPFHESSGLWGDNGGLMGLSQGAAAAFDGILPIFDPFENAYRDECGNYDAGTEYSKWLAAMSRDVYLMSGGHASRSKLFNMRGAVRGTSRARPLFEKLSLGARFPRAVLAPVGVPFATSFHAAATRSVGAWAARWLPYAAFTSLSGDAARLGIDAAFFGNE